MRTRNGAWDTWDEVWDTWDTWDDARDTWDAARDTWDNEICKKRTNFESVLRRDTDRVSALQKSSMNKNSIMLVAWWHLGTNRMIGAYLCPVYLLEVGCTRYSDLSFIPLSSLFFHCRCAHFIV